ncbi:MAG: hypothetical protein DRO39_00820 [Thermoprotei archaeon]|nr:MAG: hypothetical protein DRO39_00820 [Thermoprotei archaeon]
MPPLCIFDIDGVLLDVTLRLSKAQELARILNRDFWDTFFSEELLSLDTPRRVGIELLRRCLARGLAVAIITGRPRRIYRETVEQLKRIGVDVKFIWRILMRRNNDLRPSPIVKLELVKELVKMGGIVLEIHDDDEEFLRLVKHEIPGAHLYLHIGDTYVRYA